MSQGTSAPMDTSNRQNGKAGLDGAWPQFPALGNADQTLPRLHMSGARTVARDRWERLVTAI